MVIWYNEIMNKFESNTRTMEKPGGMLQGMLAVQSREVNERVKNEYGLNDLLSSDASLDPKGYGEIYSSDEMKAHEQKVKEYEIEFSRAHIPNAQANYKAQYNIDTEEGIIKKWKEHKNRDKSGRMEMAVTGLLSQKLGKNFLVVRTAPYDDYKHGVDNLIIDLRNGQVVGAFDEVHENGDLKRTKEKKDKIQTSAKYGGVKIVYGLKLENGRLVRAPLNGIPKFYLSLGTKQLEALEQGLGNNDIEKTDEIFKLLLDSLRAQCDELKEHTNIKEFHVKLDSFKKTINAIISYE